MLGDVFIFLLKDVNKIVFVSMISINSFAVALSLGSLFKHLDQFFIFKKLRKKIKFWEILYLFKIEFKFGSLSWGIGFSIIAL